MHLYVHVILVLYARSFPLPPLPPRTPQVQAAIEAGLRDEWSEYKKEKKTAVWFDEPKEVRLHFSREKWFSKENEEMS